MQFLRNIFYAFPLKLRKRIRQLYFLPSDILNQILGKSKREIPPDGKNFIGPGDFEKIGNEFFEYFKTYGHIQSDSVILEIGCGMGRMALPFKTFLNHCGAYYGFDIVDEGINWCSQKIAPNDKRFNFQKVDIYNKLYNPKGVLEADNFSFPYPDNFFDFVFATSVFTHMLPSQISHYIAETKRVLKPGKIALFTFFIMDDFALYNVEKGKSFMNFKHKGDHYFTINKKIEESNIAVEKKWLLEQFERNNFTLLNEKYGSWSGRIPFLSFQDILVFKN